NRICSIDIFRYICAILVVAIHTSPFADINNGLGYVFVEIIPRIAVPFFFITSGYYYIRGIEQGVSKFKIYVFRLLSSYALWSLIYYVVDFIKWGHMNLKGFAANCVYSFFVTGSHYHFWFFPAMITATCFVTLIYKTKLQKYLFPITMLLYIIGCLGCSYRTIGLQIPVLSALFGSDVFIVIRRIFLMGIPFFSAGAIVDWVESLLPSGLNRHAWNVGLLASAVALWLIEIAIVTNFNLSDNIVITPGLYLLVVSIFIFLQEWPCERHSTLADGCHLLADFTYYVHPLVIFILQKSAEFFSAKIEHTLLFVLTVIVSALAMYTYRMCRGVFDRGLQKIGVRSAK
ncbi:MAG: acyltransferase, partial [Clostridia bacterium]|nr:acyltransferase [Clostridia bacterium]